MAHKKAQWSTSNGRDSNAQRLWVKVYGNQPVKAGGIIVRQKGNKFWPADGVSQGKDFTLFAQSEWMVKFTEKRRTRFDGRAYKDIYVSVV
jgi:large subunit ribosomal protein L27